MKRKRTTCCLLSEMGLRGGVSELEVRVDVWEVSPLTATISSTVPCVTSLPMSATPSKRPRAPSAEQADSPLKNGQRPAFPPPEAPPPPPSTSAEPPSDPQTSAASEAGPSNEHVVNDSSVGETGAVGEQEESSDEEEQEVYDDKADQAARTDMYLDTVSASLLDSLLWILTRS